MSDQAERFARARSTEPPVEVGQRWSAPSEDGTVLRRIRILAPHPDGGWITEDLPSKLFPNGRAGMNRCPEFNLRYVFTLEET